MTRRIGYVLKKFPRNSETFILNEILELERQGVEVTVFSLNRPDDGVFHRALSELRRPVVYLQTRKTDATLANLRSQLPMLRGAVQGLWREFEDLIASGRPDVWQVLGWGIDVAAMARERGIERLHAHFATVAAHVARVAHNLTGIPFSVTCHAKDIYREGVTAPRFTSLLGRSDFVVTVCEANKRHIVEQLGGDALDVRVLYNGVDTSAFHPRNRTPDHAPHVLGVGRLVEKKGFHLLLEALARMAVHGSKPRCSIVGDGEERQKLEKQARQLGLEHVAFLGMRTQDEVRTLMQQASVMVLPCIIGTDGNRDALPTVLLEAMAAGLPVMSSPVGGVEEIVDHGRAGVLVAPGDVDALARAMTALLADPSKLASLAAAGRARAVSHFDLATNVGRLRSWYEAPASGSTGS